MLILEPIMWPKVEGSDWPSLSHMPTPGARGTRMGKGSFWKEIRVLELEAR